MGWSYRKSVNLGPFRVNLSKSGVGYSLGGKDFRVGSGCMGAVLLMVVLATAGIQLFLYSW
jgi:hypothetical protein